MTNSVQNTPQAFKHVQNGAYEAAALCIKNMEENELPAFYDDSKNFVHFLIKENNDQSRELLDAIIEKAKNEISKFQDTFPFEYALKSKKFETFSHLVTKNFDVCRENEISKCLNLIAREGLSKSCHDIVPQLNDKNIHLITEGPNSPLMESIRKNNPVIFDIFLQRVPEAIRTKRNVVKSLNEKGRNILHVICEQPHGVVFLQILSKRSRLKLVAHEPDPGHYFDEIIPEINKPDPNGETLLSLAVKTEKTELVKKLIEYGADVDVSSNGIKPREIKGISEKMKGVLLDAEYGFIYELKESPLTLKETTKERKKQGLIRCCREGKIEKAEKLIKEYDLNPFDSNNLLSDENGNSLLMILLSEKVEVEQIIKFVDLLEKTFQQTIDINQLNGNRDNLLIFAIEKSAKDFVFYLIDKHFHKIKINHKNNQEQTALTHAAKLEDNTILEKILEKFKGSISLSKINIGNEKQGNVVLHSLVKNYQKVTEDLKGELQRNETALTELKNSHQKTLKDHKFELLEIQKQLSQEKLKFNKHKIQSKKDVENKEKEVFLAAIKLKGKALKYTRKDLREDKEFILAAIKENGQALQYVQENLRKDEKFILAAIKENGQALQYVHEDLRKNKGFISIAVKQNGHAFQYALENLRNDKKVVLAAVIQNGLALQYAHENLRKDKKVVLAAVNQNGEALKYAHKDLRKDEEFVLTAVKQNSEALKYAHKDLRKDEEFVLTAVKQNGEALQYTHENFRNDRKVVLAAVKQNGKALQYAHENLRKDTGICLAAVIQNDLAIQFAH